MATEYGIDAGNVLARAEEITSARLRNKFLPKSLELEQQGAELANAASATRNKYLEPGLKSDLEGSQLRNAAARQTASDDATIRGIQTDAMGPDPTPAQRIAAISPAAAQQFVNFYNGLDEDKKKATQESVDQMGRIAAWIKSQPDPAEAYDRAKELFPEDARKNMPATYDENWVDVQLAQATDLDELIKGLGGEAADDLTKGAPANFMWTDSTHTAVKPIPGGPKDPKSATGGGGLDTAASNAIKSAVVLRLGGLYDPITQEMSGLGEDEWQTSIDLMAAAEQFMIDEGLPVAQAVKKAFAASGGGTDAGTGGAGTEADPAKPISQEDYDGLASGAWFINPADGAKKQKP